MKLTIDYGDDLDGPKAATLRMTDGTILNIAAPVRVDVRVEHADGRVYNIDPRYIETVELRGAEIASTLDGTTLGG